MQAIPNENLLLRSHHGGEAEENYLTLSTWRVTLVASHRKLFFPSRWACIGLAAMMMQNRLDYQFLRLWRAVTEPSSVR